MDRERFQRVMEVFDRARDLKGEAQSEFLQAACRGDAGLRAEVDRLLLHDAQPAQAFRTTQAGGAAILADALHRDAKSDLPHQIGRYKIIRLIGEGGMGTVYEAQQDQPRRTVALKVLRGGLSSPSLLRRFAYEAQVLGRLQHPGIAHIIEAGLAGEDAASLPYLVMEFVAGHRFDEFVRERKLSLRERLNLFVQVCEAVQHAHQKGVIHRDLKPANILVVKNERASTGDSVPSSSAQRDVHAGRVKVLDFGLAKLTDPDAGLSTVITQTGHVQGTLAYMSPEQARGQSDEIDIRTDVYSLGVILYELLTDELPYDVSRVMFPDAVRMICESPPRRPSVASKTLRGDLETIVLKALEKEPSRRYPSVASFAEDLDRFLSSQPILARKPSAAYQLRKMIGRHRLPFAFAATMLLLVAAFGVWMTILYSRAESQRIRAIVAEDQSQIEAQTSRQVTQFLVNLFKVSNPDEARGNSITAREVLDRGAERVRAELKDEPQVQSALMNAIGTVYMNLGLLKEATPFLEDSMKLRRQQTGEDSISYAESLESLAALKDEQGDTVDPEPMLRMALEIRLRHQPRQSASVAELQNNLGAALYRKGNLVEAEKFYREALATRKELFGLHHADTARCLGNLGGLLGDRGIHKEAEELLRQAVAIHRETLEPDHPDLGVALRILAEELQASGKLDEAESMYRESLDIHRKVLGPDNAQTGEAIEGLAKITFLKGKLAEAEPLYREALRIQLLTLDEKHGRVITTINNLGAVLFRRGDIKDAAQMWERALALTRQRVGEDHINVAIALNNLAIIYWENEEWDKAVGAFEESLKIKKARLGEQHEDVALTIDNLGSVYRDRGDLERAEALLTEAFEIRKKVLGPTHPDVALSLNNLGELSAVRGDGAGAETLFQESIRIFLDKLGPMHPHLAYPLLQLGRLRLQSGDPVGAEKYFRRALEIRSAALSSDSAELAMTKSCLGASLTAQMRFDESRPLLIEGYSGLLASKGPDHRETRMAYARFIAWYGNPNPFGF